MPIVIGKEPDKSKSNAQTKEKHGKPSDHESRPPGNLNSLPLPAVIGIGVVALLFVLFMFNHYVMRITPKTGPGYEKVAPPPGYPDEPPYNDAAWQKHRTPTPGMPPPEALERMKGGGAPAGGSK